MTAAETEDDQKQTSTFGWESLAKHYWGQEPGGETGLICPLTGKMGIGQMGKGGTAIPDNGYGKG